MLQHKNKKNAKKKNPIKETVTYGKRNKGFNTAFIVV